MRLATLFIRIETFGIYTGVGRNIDALSVHG